MKKYSTLLTLYLAQSIPMSFFSTIVPVIMRQENYSLAMIGLLQLIKLPWILKFLWAPIVDRYGNSVSNYKKWIFTSEIVYAIIIVSIGFLDLSFNFSLIVILMVIAFTASATQDIATDAFAILILKKEERSLGNSMQSAGTFLGTMAGSGVLLIMYYYFGWQGMMMCLGGFVMIALIPLYFYKQKKASLKTAGLNLNEQHEIALGAEVGETLSKAAVSYNYKTEAVSQQVEVSEAEENAIFNPHSTDRIFEEVLTVDNRILNDYENYLEKNPPALIPAGMKDIGLFFRQKGITRRIILLFFFYSGLIGILSLIKPFMVDNGFNVQQIGIISGIFGTASGALSALFAGFLIRKIGRKKSLYLFAMLGVFTTLYFVWMVSGDFSRITLYSAIALLWITYAMSSVGIYTISMDVVRKGREGTDFTIQIVITHLSGIIVAVASGRLADIFDFKGLFIIESILAVLVLLSLPILYREKISSHDDTPTASR